jgi:hypothetical protein
LPAGFLLTGQLLSLYAITQPSKIVEGLNFHGLRSRRDFDNKDLVLIPLHSLMNVCEVNEVVFRYQGIFASSFMMDGN